MTNNKLKLNNKIQSILDWSKELNVPVSTLRNRFLRKWFDEKILTFPIRPKKKKNES